MRGFSFSVFDLDDQAYIDAQLGYYETGDYFLHRGFVLDAYRDRTAYPAVS
jgi:hypothetical protein